MPRLNRILGIVVHCSASQWGNAGVIDQWHRARGWSGIGYHGVILNGHAEASGVYRYALDGKIEPGRSFGTEGAHCLAGGMNTVALGVCLIGAPGFPGSSARPAPKGVSSRPYVTERQYAALVHWLAKRCAENGLDPEGTFRHPATHARIPVITQHSDHDRGKPLCASVNIKALRRRVAEAMREGRYT